MESPEEPIPGLKFQLALAIAEGKAIDVWASQNGVSRRTAFRWATEPEVRARVAFCRRCVLDRAVGLLTNRLTKSVEEIGTLADNATSESVKLAALKSIISSTLAVTEFANLEQRMARVEEQLNERNDTTDRTG